MVFRYVWLLAVLLFWGFMIHVLYEREIMPSFQRAEAPSYRTALQVMVKEGEVVFGIHQAGRRKGTMIRRVSEREEGGYLMHSSTRLRVLKIGELKFSMDMFIDSDYKLERFEASFGMSAMHGSIEGKRIGIEKQTKLQIKGNLGGTTFEREIPFDSNMTFGTEFDPILSMPHLELNKTWTTTVMSGLLMGQPKTQIVEARVDRREEMKYDGIERIVYVVIMETKGSSLNKQSSEIYITPDGHILREELTTMKMSLRRESPLPVESDH